MKRYYGRPKESERYEVRITERDLQDVTTQTDLVYRGQSWNEQLGKWSRGRFYYGYKSCSAVLRRIVMVPMVVLKQVTEAQRTVICVAGGALARGGGGSGQSQR